MVCSGFQRSEETGLLIAARAVGCLKLFMFGMARPAWDRTQRSSEPVATPPAWPSSYVRSEGCLCEGVTASHDTY